MSTPSEPDPQAMLRQNSLRQSITFTRPQLAYLRDRAERLDITLSDLIRRIVDEYREEHIA